MKDFSDEEGLPKLLACAEGEQRWLAGGVEARAGIALCLPATLAHAVEVPMVTSVTEPGRKVIQAWWIGTGALSAARQGDQLIATGSVLLSQRTRPASFTGGVPDERVQIEGTPRMVE